MDRKVSRRSFLHQASAGALGLTLLSRSRGAAAPSDRITVAHIGLGGMGRNHLSWFAAFPDVEIAALCDVDREHLEQAQTELKKLRPESRAQGYADFRKVLERQDIDVVTCATPDHWHSRIAMLAFEAGKDVYGEKPLSYCAAEGRAMLESQRRTKRIFQLGTQIHAGDNYHRVVELLRSGALGEIHTVRLWMTSRSPGLGFPANRKPPEALDWDMWLGPAPMVPYNPARCHFSYRYFLDYSGGVFQDFWCHIADIVFWALEPRGLKSIEARGEPPYDGIADAPGWIEVDYEFEGLKLHWTTVPPAVPGAEGKNLAAFFEGTEGTLLCTYDTREIRLGGQVLQDLDHVPKSIPRSPGHQRNFLDSVKSRSQPESNLEYVRQMTLPLHLGLISYRLRRKLAWDSANERFIGDPAADYLLSRPGRSPWNIG